MADEPETSEDETESSKEISTIAEDRRFPFDELIACAACLRTNPPNRAACLYCGSDLELTELLPGAVRLSLQGPESWEDGFTIAYLGQGRVDDNITAEAAEILRLEPDILAQLMRSGAPAPVAYLRSLSEAQIAASRLTEIGFPSRSPAMICSCQKCRRAVSAASSLARWARRLWISTPRRGLNLPKRTTCCS